MLGSSKPGRISESASVMLAARRKPNSFPRLRSSWTIEAMPRSSPSAVGGYHGSVSLLIANFRLPISDCQFLDSRPQGTIRGWEPADQSVIDNQQCSYHSVYGLPSDPTSGDAL